MKLTIIKSDVLDDWYLIERAEHDGREWIEPAGFGSKFCRSARLCGDGGNSADIEGTGAEMKEIAKAIRDRRRYAAKRCFVDAKQARVFLGSPRNDNGNPGEVSLAEALDLAAQIEALLGSPPQPSSDSRRDHQQHDDEQP